MTEQRPQTFKRPGFLITVALLAILIALSASMVSSQQNQATREMIEQTKAHDDYTSASTKMRLAFLELQNHREDVQADPSRLPRLTELASDYIEQRNSAKAWDDSYSPVLAIRLNAARAYRIAQLIAVAALIVAALSLVIAHRAAFFASTIICAISLAQFGITYIHATTALRPNLAKVDQTREDYQQLRNSYVASREDEEALDRLDPNRAIRDRLDAARSGHHQDPRQDLSK